MSLKRWRNKAHLDKIRGMPCCICGNEAAPHHIVGHGESIMGNKAPDSLCMPLCVNHHTGKDGIHTIGLKEFESRYGPQWRMVAKTLAKVVESA